MISNPSWLFAVACLLLPACGQKASPQGPVAARPPTVDEVAERLDSRKPVPLLPMMAQHQKENMRNHLLAVQEIVAALGRDDFDAIREATKKIGYSDSMAQMCNHMGAGAPGFTEVALDFHRTADTIGVAAGQRDRVAVHKALAATLERCVGCHATYKQRLVDETGWQQATAAPSPTGAHDPQ